MPRRKEVDTWFASYENPMKEVVLKIRDIILAADPRIDECIKWQAPTFTYEGNLASFFPKSKKHASLMFHQGAQIPGKHSRLEGDSEIGRSLKLASVEDAIAATSDLERIVRAWCDWRDEAGAPPTKTSAKKTKKAKKASAKPTAKKTKTKAKASAKPKK